MEIKINVRELLGREYEGEAAFATLLKDEILEIVSANVVAITKKQIEEAIEKELIQFREEVLATAFSKAADELSGVLDEEYRTKDKYGREGQATTTLRAEIKKTIVNECTFEESYGSRNRFSSYVKEVIEKEVKTFKQGFDALVNEKFIREALDYAVSKLKTQLGIE